MKRCPTCKRTFEDDTQRFCLEDGSELDVIPETIAGPTLVLPTDEPLPTISQAARPDVPLPRLPETSREPGSNQGRVAGVDTQGSSGATAIIGAVMALAVILFLVGLGLWGFIYVRRIPLAVFCVVGMSIAMTRVRRYRRPSLMAGLALGFLMVEAFVNSGIGFLLNKAGASMTLSYTSISSLYSVLNVLDDFAFAAVIAVMVAAALIGRKK